MSKKLFEDEIERLFEITKPYSDAAGGEIEKMFEQAEAEACRPAPVSEFDNYDDMDGNPMMAGEASDEPDPVQHITSLRITNGQGGQVLVSGSNGLSSLKFVDPYELAKYSIEDIDKLIMMLTLWIDDISTRDKLEEIYKYWKELQRK